MGARSAWPGVNATLGKSGKTVGHAVSDVFGEFKIDKLDPDSGCYELTLEAVGGKRATRTVQLGRSQYLGVFEL